MSDYATQDDIRRVNDARERLVQQHRSRRAAQRRQDVKDLLVLALLLVLGWAALWMVG